MPQSWLDTARAKVREVTQIIDEEATSAASRASELARRAADKAAELVEDEPPRPMVVVFERAGPLGLHFDSHDFETAGVPIILTQIELDSEANGHPSLRVGAQLYAINGMPVEPVSFNEVLQMFRTRTVPTSLTFLQQGGAMSFLRERAASAGEALRTIGGRASQNSGETEVPSEADEFEEVALDAGTSLEAASLQVTDHCRCSSYCCPSHESLSCAVPYAGWGGAAGDHRLFELLQRSADVLCSTGARAAGERCGCLPPGAQHRRCHVIIANPCLLAPYPRPLAAGRLLLLSRLLLLCRSDRLPIPNCCRPGAMNPAVDVHAQVPPRRTRWVWRRSWGAVALARVLA
jgi:hypothetical protein